MSKVFPVICEGDSLTFSYQNYPYAYAGTPANLIGGDGLAIRYQTRFFIGSDIVGCNASLSGSRLTELLARAATVDAMLPSNYPPLGLRITQWPDTRPSYLPIFSLMIGTNVSDSNPMTFAASVRSYCLARKAAGCAALILGTLLDRGDNIISNFDTAYRQPYNAIVRTYNWENDGVSGIFDLAADPVIGVSGACNNTDLWNADKVHPLPSTQATYMAPIWGAKLLAVKATL